MATDFPEPVAPAIRTWGIFLNIGDYRLAGNVQTQTDG